MEIVCPKCEYVIDRDKYIEGQLIEEYNNIYGTCCPKCGKFIAPLQKSKFFTNNELKRELLREEMRERLKRKFRRK